MTTNNTEPPGDDLLEVVAEAAPVWPSASKPTHTAPPIIILEPQSVWDLLADESIREPDYVIQGILALGDVLMLAGPPKAMKSWTVALIALRMATGLPWLNYSIQSPFKVLYLSAEGRKGRLKKRLQLLTEPSDADENGLRNLYVISTGGKLKLDDQSHQEIFLRIVEPYEIVILDPLYRFLANGDENSHADQRAIQNFLDLIKNTGKAIIIVHHLRKATSANAGIDEIRGAGWSGYVDGALILTRRKSKDDDRFSLSFFLRNDEEPDTLQLSKEKEGVVLSPISEEMMDPLIVADYLQGQELASGDLKKGLKKLHPEVSPRTIARAMKEALGNPKEGIKPLIDFRKEGRKHIYFVPEQDR